VVETNVGPAGLFPPGPIHHVGVIVTDLDEAVASYQALGFVAEPRERLAAQNVDVAPLHAGDSWIELICPLDHDSGVGRFLDARGPGMHHVAYLVDDLDGTLAQLAAMGVELIDAQPRVGLHGWRIAFIHPRSCAGVLTELVERDSTM
jgi:methylmalonyl-CoA/ethylmalonyl-CoA epimerase